MRKVVVLLPDLSVAGGQKMALEIAKENLASGFFLFQFVCLGKNGHTVLDEDAQRYGIPVIYLGKEKGFDIRIIPKLLSAVKEFAPDIIHCHLPRMHYYLPALLFSGARKKYYTVHNLADKEDSGRLHNCVLRFAFHLCRVQPVAISPKCRLSIEQVYGIPEEKIPCIYVGIDLKRFARPAAYEIQTPFRFAATGRLSEQKNYPMMLRAFSSVHQHYPNSELVIMGEGDLRAELEHQCETLNLRQSVRFTGNIPKVQEELWTAHAYLMSSDYEGLPQTVLEAMAAGLPIISTKAGGVVDVVEHEKNGLLADCGDQEGLIHAMERLIQSPKLCKQFSECSVALVQKYSIAACAEQYKELYLA